MKNILFVTLSIALLVTLTGCATTTPTADPTAGMSKEEYQQMKEQSARMGMSMEDHTKMLQDDK